MNEQIPKKSFDDVLTLDESGTDKNGIAFFKRRIFKFNYKTDEMQEYSLKCVQMETQMLLRSDEYWKCEFNPLKQENSTYSAGLKEYNGLNKS